MIPINPHDPREEDRVDPDGGRMALANALARVSFTLDLPERMVADWTKDVDDPGGDGFERAMHIIEERVADDLPFLLDYMTAGAPDVEAHA